MIVYPGILAQSKEEIFSRIELFTDVVDGFHIDIMDGEFVPNKTVPLEGIGSLPKGFFEAHLMVAHPDACVDLCAEVGFSRVLVHLDALENSDLDLACELQTWAHELDMEFGLVFQRGRSVPVDERLKQFDYAMVMTIDLGFSGQPFKVDQLAEIKALRAQCPLLPIAADGHVDTITAPDIVAAGATHLVSTSFLTGVDALKKYSLLKGI